MDRPPKKPKVVTVSIVSDTLATNKLHPKPSLGKGKVLMKGPDPITEKCHVLLREDSRYVLKQLSSIIKDVTMRTWVIMLLGPWGRRTYLVWHRYAHLSPFSYFVLLLSCSNLCFIFLQGVVMMKGLMDRCTSHETVMSRLREKVEAREMELRELMTWKEVQVNKLDLTRQLLEESEAQVEVLKKILKDKEGEILEAKGQHHQAKEVAVRSIVTPTPS